MQTLLIIVFAVLTIAAQQAPRCEVRRQAPPTGFWTWRPQATVKVYINQNQFKPEEVPLLIAPLATWNAVASETGANVVFDYQGLTLDRLLCENCLTIVRGNVFDKKTRHATELHAYSANSNQIITYAAIVIDLRLTNPETLTNAVTHELGHSFGLLDCYSCRPHSTVMGQFPALNVSNGMNPPSACDKTQVKSVYDSLRAMRILPAPLAAKQIMIDDGEEPEDDDTPVVLPKP